MPELTLDELSALFAWIVDAKEYVPAPPQANEAIDKLIAYQGALKQKEENKKTIATFEAWGKAMWSDKNIAEFGNLL